MYVRCAYFIGDVAPEHRERFDGQMRDVIGPAIAGMPGCRGVRLLFGREFEEGAPAVYLTIEHAYDDPRALAGALASPERDAMWARLSEIMPLFTGSLVHVNHDAVDCAPA